MYNVMFHFIHWNYPEANTQAEFEAENITFVTSSPRKFFLNPVALGSNMGGNHTLKNIDISKRRLFLFIFNTYWSFWLKAYNWF